MHNLIRQYDNLKNKLNMVDECGVREHLDIISKLANT